MMVLISFLLLIKNYSYYLLGFYIAAIFLIHPLTLFFYLPVLIIYFFIKFFSNIQNKRLILKGFFSISLMIVVIYNLLIPYMINYPEEISEIYYWYNYFTNNSKYNNSFNNVSMENLIISLSQMINLDFLRNFINSDLLNRWDYMTNESIQCFFTASFLGIFVNIFNRNKKS